MKQYKLHTGVIIDVPTHLNELTIVSYLRLYKFVYNENYDLLDDFDKSSEIISIICNQPLDDIYLEEYTDLINITNNINLLDANNINNIPKKWSINGIDYSIKDSFDENVFGEIFFINQSRLSNDILDYIPKILSVLIRPYNITYSKEFPNIPFKELDLLDYRYIPYRSKLFLNCKMGEMWGVINRFFNWEDSIRMTFRRAFEQRKTVQTNMNQMSQVKIDPKWSWIGLLDRLTNKNIKDIDTIMNKNYIEILNFLCYWDITDEAIEKQNAKNEAASKRNNKR